MFSPHQERAETEGTSWPVEKKRHITEHALMVLETAPLTSFLCC